MEPARKIQSGTESNHYTQRLQNLSGAQWKRLLNVQAPYQWNLRRLQLGATLDVGCGIGRNSSSLGFGSVGVDHNPFSIEQCRRQGIEAYLSDDFFARFPEGSRLFDSLLIAHVFEHMSFEQDVAVLKQYTPYLKPRGRAVFITPQEAGYASDSTHVEFMPFERLKQIAQAAGLSTERAYSFPFPRFVGRFFKYNEFVLVARK